MIQQPENAYAEAPLYTSFALPWVPIAQDPLNIPTAETENKPHGYDSGCITDWMREFHKQFPSGQASRYNRFQYQGGLTNQIPPYGLGSYTFPSGGPFVQEDPYEKWRDFCSLYANPGSTQIQLWQLLSTLHQIFPILKWKNDNIFG